MVNPLARLNPGHVSTCASVAFLALLLGLALATQRLMPIIYALSFWHYYLYGLAFYFGAAALDDFKRDAMLMKLAALAAIGWVYLAMPISVPSLLVVLAGFALNARAAWVLGSDRTYYGYELAGFPPLRVTTFPYSWFAHPMLVGNMAAYGGTLLNEDFRRQWWPLAVAHVTLNVVLLLMELYVRPQRRRRQSWNRPPLTLGRWFMQAGVFLGCGAAVVLVLAAATDTFLGVALGLSINAYAHVLYRCYAEPNSIPAKA